MKKYFGVLHYRNKKSKLKKILQGPPGVGFKLTNDGNNVENKWLVNVNEPKDDKDVVIYIMFVKNMNELIKDFADLDNRLESLRTDNDDRGEYMEEVTRSVWLNTAALEDLKREQASLNNYVRLILYHKLFVGVASNVQMTNKKVVEFQEVISSFNIKMVTVNDISTVVFSTEGYYRLAIQFYCEIKYSPYIQIELFGNSITKLLEHKKLSPSDISKSRNVLCLKTLALTFYNPKENSLIIHLYEKEFSTDILDEVRIIIERIN